MKRNMTDRKRKELKMYFPGKKRRMRAA